METNAAAGERVLPNLVMLERGETVPESDAREALPRFDRLAHTLREDNEAEPIFEQLSARIGEKV